MATAGRAGRNRDGEQGRVNGIVFVVRSIDMRSKDKRRAFHGKNRCEGLSEPN